MPAKHFRTVAAMALTVALGAMLGACSEPSFTSVQQHDREHIPPKLSDWGLFLRRGETLQMHPELMPYTLATPLFTDYAQKLRTVWLPAGTTVRYQEAEDTAGSDLQFPVGTIISKTFYYPKTENAAGTAADGVLKVRALAPGLPGFTGEGLDLNQVQLVETRLLVHQADGWQALPYVWNAQQSDAELALGGDWQDFRLQREDGSETEFTYVVPDANQCAGCHASNLAKAEPRPIGPKLRHLNRDFPYVDGPANQILHWQQSGRLSDLPAAESWPAGIAASDTRWTLDQRARAYLDINCSHCHNPQGPADTSGLFLQPGTALGRALGLCKPPVAAGKGSGGLSYDLVPGNPEQSILHYRMLSTNPGEMMPELGRSLVHEAGLALIAEWIRGMDGECGG